jgi:hypothetical protein
MVSTVTKCQKGLVPLVTQKPSIATFDPHDEYVDSREVRVPICCCDRHAALSSHLLAMMISDWSPHSDMYPCRVPQPTAIHLPVASVCLKFQSSGQFGTASESRSA